MSTASVPMTFEEHFAAKFPGGVEAFLAVGGHAKTIVEFARDAWNGAIESKKPVTSVIPYKGYDAVGERWTFPDNICNAHFSTRAEAVEWAVDRGYRVTNA